MLSSITTPPTLIFKSVWAIPDPLHSHENFRTFLTSPTKNTKISLKIALNILTWELTFINIRNGYLILLVIFSISVKIILYLFSFDLQMGNLFYNIKSALHFNNVQSLTKCIILLIHFYICDFCHNVQEWIRFVIFLFCNLFYGIWYQVYASFIKWVGKFFSFFILWWNLYKIDITS